MPASRSVIGPFLLLGAAVVAGVLLLQSDRPGRAPVELSGPESLAEAFREGRSGVIVEADAVVERLLDDDREGSRHQRLIVRVSPEHTVLIAHNVDVAPRIPAEVGDRLRFRGQYEWNPRGGVVHWTHDDPRGEHPAGWVELDGRRYR